MNDLEWAALEKWQSSDEGAAERTVEDLYAIIIAIKHLSDTRAGTQLMRAHAGRIKMCAAMLNDAANVFIAPILEAAE